MCCVPESMRTNSWPDVMLKTRRSTRRALRRPLPVPRTPEHGDAARMFSCGAVLVRVVAFG
jgi:hypothetical protein